MRRSLAILGTGLATCCAASPAAAVSSLTPNDIHAAYALPRTGAAHQTIAIVSAYDDPGVQADLNDYTRRFKIPACTTANGCFRILNAAGSASPLPAPDPTGGQYVAESSIGVEVARGVCQSCSIMLVEANSFIQADLSAAVATAARAGAGVIVTTSEVPAGPEDAQYAPDYSDPRSVVVAASGDSGYGGTPSFPAALPGVLAVGGTNLQLTRDGRYGHESAWDRTTSGCSLFDPAASWQAGPAAAVGCGSHRAVADLAAVASPGPLVHIRDAGSPCGPAWCEADGTSVAAPIIAGVIGLAGSAGGSESRLLYEHARSDPGAFRDVTSGSTSGCTGQPICAARRGYDGPTGLGTPDGLAAFLASGGAIDRHHPAIALAAPGNRLRTSAGWTARLGVSNANAFAVHGSVAVRRRLRVGGRLQMITFATARVALGPLASATETLTIARGERGLLTGLHSFTATVAISASGPAGRSVAVTRSFLLSAP